MKLILLTICIIAFLYVLFHLRPLSEDEEYELGGLRRKKCIRQYFSFSRNVSSVDKTFKKSMNSNGAFYEYKANLHYFPSIAAALLKYKKHEWIIIGFEKRSTVEYVWINKGVNREQAYVFLSAESIVQTAKERGITSVLIFHNHPNVNPNLYNCTKPSEQDIITAREYSDTLIKEGINLMEFVCERGNHYQYFLSITDTFKPLCNFIEKIKQENGHSSLSNLSLHSERIFPFLFS